MDASTLKISQAQLNEYRKVKNAEKLELEHKVVSKDLQLQREKTKESKAKLKEAKEENVALNSKVQQSRGVKFK